MERVGDRKGKLERYCSNRPQRAVAPTEEEVRTFMNDKYSKRWVRERGRKA
jgi:hypothetical protein